VESNRLTFSLKLSVAVSVVRRISAMVDKFACEPDTDVEESVLMVTVTNTDPDTTLTSRRSRDTFRSEESAIRNEFLSNVSSVLSISKVATITGIRTDPGANGSGEDGGKNGDVSVAGDAIGSDCGGNSGFCGGGGNGLEVGGDKGGAR